MANAEKSCIKRLMHDLEELKKAPVDNVSAAPLDDNMLEWHCNIRQGEMIYHLILFFPPEYPYKSPSAEFVPNGFDYRGGATKNGKKGTQICLSIFSDFEFIHTEWAKEKSAGWCPGYTVQTVLMNVVAFLAEHQATSGQSFSKNLRLSQNYTCRDCDHTYGKPSPGLGHATKTDTSEATEAGNSLGDLKSKDSPQIVDYISKEKFKEEGPQSDDDLFGYGLVVSGPMGRAQLTTPCEFLTARSFYGMKSTMNVVHSVLKEELSYFLPLFVHPNHGSRIRGEFEKVMQNLSAGIIVPSSVNIPVEEMVMKTLPNLMCATVVEFSKGTQRTSENSLNGYFALHRLFLWALDTYPSLQGKVDMVLENFVKDERKRRKTECPNVGQWLMLLSASQKFKWQDVSKAYLTESFRRNVMWYVKDDPQLADTNTDKNYRLERTFKQTIVSRNLLAFQVVFLDVAMPAGMSRGDIIKRYDENLGFPTKSMVETMKDECDKINNHIRSFADWYSILKLPAPTDQEIFEILVDAVRFASTTNGYFFGTPSYNSRPRYSNQRY